MSKKMNTARESYLWLEGQSLRTSHPISWWHGFNAAKREQEGTPWLTNGGPVPTYTGSTELDKAAFQSGYDYYKGVYHG